MGKVKKTLSGKKHCMRVGLYKKGNISLCEFSVCLLEHASVFYNRTGGRREEK